MSSSSYLGHGAKYWADLYFQAQNQTRMPDDSSAVEWREKYLNLEKSCSLYQAKLADLRTEVEDLRANSSNNPVLSDEQDAEYWHNEYLKATDEITRKEGVIQGALQKNLKLVSQIRNMPDHTYSGHDAKYWYNQLQSEKESRLTSQSALANLRKEFDTQKKSLLFEGHDAKYWYDRFQSEKKNTTTTGTDSHSIEDLHYLLSESQKSLNELNALCSKTSDEWIIAKEKNDELQNELNDAKKELDSHIQKQSNTRIKYIALLSFLSAVFFFIGVFWAHTTSILLIEIVPCLISLVVGSAFSYSLCTSKYVDAKKAQADSFDNSLKRQREDFVHDLSTIVDDLNLLSLSNAPESSYLDSEGLPHMIVDGEDICTVSFTPLGKVFHCQKNPCIKYSRSTNIAYLAPCCACSRCYPVVPELSWYGRCLSNAVILQRYGIKIHIPTSSDEAIHRPQISSEHFVTCGIANTSLEKGALNSLIRSQSSDSSPKK